MVARNAFLNSNGESFVEVCKTIQRNMGNIIWLRASQCHCDDLTAIHVSFEM